MGSNQRPLDCKTRNFARTGIGVAATPPFAEKQPRAIEFAHAQCKMDIGKEVALLPETHG